MPEQTVLLTSSTTIGPGQLTLCAGLGEEDLRTPAFAPSVAGRDCPESLSIPEMERDMVIRTLDKTDWNVTKSARLLGLTRDMLRYRIEKLGLVRPRRHG